MNNFSPVKCAESIEPLIFPIPGNFLGEISLIGRFPWFAAGEIGGLWGESFTKFHFPPNSVLRKCSPPLRREGLCVLRGFSRRYYFIIRARARAQARESLFLFSLSVISLFLSFASFDPRNVRTIRRESITLSFPPDDVIENFSPSFRSSRERKERERERLRGRGKVAHTNHFFLTSR